MTSDRGRPGGDVSHSFRHQLALLRSHRPANEAAFSDEQFPQWFERAQGGDQGGIGGLTTGFRNPMITVIKPPALLWRFVPDFDYKQKSDSGSGGRSKAPGWSGAARLSNWFVSGGTIVKLVQKARAMKESGSGLTATDCLYQTLVDGIQLPPNRMPRLATVFETRRKLGAFVGQGLTWDHLDAKDSDSVSQASDVTQRGLAQGTEMQIYVPGEITDLSDCFTIRPPILPIKSLLESDYIPTG